MPDLYEVLQVHPRAEPEVLRAAYRVLARKCHPDHGGDARRMITLNDAWDVLGDPVRRAAYDASRAAPAGQLGPEQQSPAPAPAPAAAVQRTTDVAHAGPSPGRPSGTVLDFGRYAGWSLGEIARHDLDYLEWLQRSTLGRGLRAEIEVLLAPRRGSGAARATSNRPWGRER
ncbi:MAG TPA: DnaJ domain-containing protein [Candidatus Limnocylindrales bacterium]